MNSSSETPGFYRFNVGDIEVICVNDGILTSDINAVVGVDVATVRKLFNEAHFPQDVSCTTNNYVIRAKGKTALVDTGAGSHLVDSAGKLLKNLASAGITPQDIDTILFTHVHPDHCSGLLDENFEKIFPHASLKMHKAEFEFWMAPQPRSKQLAHVVHEADHVIKFLTPYLDQIETFEDGEVFPGVRAVELHGHTPGHTGYRIQNGDGDLLIWGDVVHWPVVQFALPDAAVTYDVDPVQATQTRWDILAQVADSGLLVAGMHLFFPGFTRVKRDADAFASTPVPWGHDPFGSRA